MPNPPRPEIYIDYKQMNDENFKRYLEMRRRCLIQELREIERLLQIQQTIPERNR